MPSEQAYVDRIREFNRFYTNILGLLNRHFLDTRFSLTEGRVLYEIHHLYDCTAKKIRIAIDIDEGYLSRIIDKFVRQGLVRKTPALDDRRLHLLQLTAKGEQEFSRMNDNSNRLISRMIEELSAAQRKELIVSMRRIQALLGAE